MDGEQWVDQPRLSQGWADKMPPAGTPEPEALLSSILPPPSAVSVAQLKSLNIISAGRHQFGSHHIEGIFSQEAVQMLERGAVLSLSRPAPQHHLVDSQRAGRRTREINLGREGEREG